MYKHTTNKLVIQNVRRYIPGSPSVLSANFLLWLQSIQKEEIPICDPLPSCFQYYRSPVGAWNKLTSSIVANKLVDKPRLNSTSKEMTTGSSNFPSVTPVTKPEKCLLVSSVLLYTEIQPGESHKDWPSSVWSLFFIFSTTDLIWIKLARPYLNGTCWRLKWICQSNQQRESAYYVSVACQLWLHHSSKEP